MIIAILAGMLLPALNKARVMAKRADCVSTQKQWGLGFTLYTDSFDYYPMRYTWTSSYPSGVPTVWNWWKYIGCEVLRYPLNSSPLPGYILNNAKGKMSCAASPIAPFIKRDGSSASSGYSYQYGQMAFTALKISRIKKASLGILMADGWEEIDFLETVVASSYAWDKTPAHSHLQNRHGNVANVLYTDGHVGSVNTYTIHFQNPANSYADRIALCPVSFNVY